MANEKELEIIRLSKIPNKLPVANLKKISQLISPKIDNQILEREKLLNKYASKINAKNNVYKPAFQLKKINNLLFDNQEKIEVIEISFDLYQKVNNNILDKNFKKVINIIYYGLPKDDRPKQEKMLDPFVIFLTDEIKSITSNTDSYYQAKSDIINNILSLKKADKQKNPQVKTSIFQIWLQRIKFDMVGGENSLKDFSKREAEQKSINL